MLGVPPLHAHRDASKHWQGYQCVKYTADLRPASAEVPDRPSAYSMEASSRPPCVILRSDAACACMPSQTRSCCASWVFKHRHNIPN